VLFCFFLAVPAETDKLKQAAIYPETGSPGQALLYPRQIKSGEINHHTTIGANQVVVMPRGANRVATAAISSV